MFVDALESLGELEILFYVSPMIDLSPVAKARYVEALSNYFGVKVKISCFQTYQSYKERPLQNRAKIVNGGKRLEKLSWRKIMPVGLLCLEI